MDRAELAGMLGDQTTACEAAREALFAGGDFVVWDSHVPSQQLASIYAARLRRARKRSAETLALPSTVDILTRLEAAQVRIGCIFSPDRTWAFMLFLSERRSNAQDLWIGFGRTREGRTFPNDS